MQNRSVQFLALFALSAGACRYEQAVGNPPILQSSDKTTNAQGSGTSSGSTTRAASSSGSGSASASGAASSSGASSGSGNTTGSSAGAATSSLTRTEYMDALVTLVCGNLSAGCAKNGYTFAHRGCEAGMRNDSTLGDPGVNAAYDATAAATCLTTTPGHIAADVLDPSCTKVFTGTLPGNSTCTGNNECALPPDAKSATCNNGRCFVQYEVGLGATCEQEAQLIQQGRYQYCDSATYCDNDNVCHAPVANGLSCFGVAGAYGCNQFESYCSTSDTLCQARKHAGETCFLQDECRWEDDLFCSSSVGALGVCTARVELGSACTALTNLNGSSPTTSCTGDVPHSAAATCSPNNTCAPASSLFTQAHCIAN